MKKFVKFLVAMIMGIIFIACGDSDIDGVKSAYKEHMSDARPGLEWIINSARIAGSNKKSNLENLFNNLDEFLMSNPDLVGVLEPAFSSFATITEPNDSARVIKLLNRITLDPKDVRNFGNRIIANGVTIPKREDIDSCDWWEYEKDGTKYVAAGDKNVGYTIFKILDGGEQFMANSVCWKNVETGKMEEVTYTDFVANEQLIYSLMTALLVYDLDNGAIAKDLDK